MPTVLEIATEANANICSDHHNALETGLATEIGDLLGSREDILTVELDEDDDDEVIELIQQFAAGMFDAVDEY